MVKKYKRNDIIKKGIRVLILGFSLIVSTSAISTILATGFGLYEVGKVIEITGGYEK